MRMFECWYGDALIACVDQSEMERLQEAGTKYNFIEVTGYWKFVVTGYVDK